MINYIHFRTLKARRPEILQSVTIRLTPANASRFNISIPKTIKPYAISNLADIEFNQDVLKCLRYRTDIDDEALKAEIRLGLINNTAYLGEQAVFSNDISVLCNYDKNPYPSKALSVSYSKIDAATPKGLTDCIASLPGIFSSIRSLSLLVLESIKPGSDYGSVLLRLPYNSGGKKDYYEESLGYFVNRLDSAFLFFSIIMWANPDFSAQISQFRQLFEDFCEEYTPSINDALLENDLDVTAVDIDTLLCRIFVLCNALERELTPMELHFFLSIFLY